MNESGKIDNIILILQFIFVGVVFVGCFYFACCIESDILINNGVVYESHSVIDVEFKSITGSKQPMTSNGFEYDVTVETGEVFSTNIDNLNIGEKYIMEINEFVDKEKYRYISSVIKDVL